VQFAEIACRRPTTTTLRKTVTTGARVSARRAPLQPLNDGAQRQQPDRTYGLVGESIGEGLWVAIWDSMPPRHESARAFRVESDNAGRLTPAPTQTSNAQRVAVRMPFQPPRPTVQIPGAATESALLVPIITGSVVSDTGPPTIEPTLPIDLMSGGSSANSTSSDTSPPTEVGEIPGNTSEALDMEVGSSDDDGDPALPDDTAKDAVWVPPVPGDTVTLRQPMTINPIPRMLVGFISTSTVGFSFLSFLCEAMGKVNDRANRTARLSRSLICAGAFVRCELVSHEVNVASKLLKVRHYFIILPHDMLNPITHGIGVFSYLHRR